MMQEEGTHKSGLVSCNVTPKKSQRTPQASGSEKREMKSRLQEIKYTPNNSPDKYQKTPESSGSSRKDTMLQTEIVSSKRKSRSPHDENLDKIQKTCSGGKFVNTLIGQWSKHIGVQNPLPQTGWVQENLIIEEMKRKHAMEERKIQMLQKKLQVAEKIISSLSTSRDAELQAKEEILRQLDSDWESITKYYYEISESLKGFQQHKDNLTRLYNDVIVAQQSTVKTLQQELSNIKLGDEKQRNIVAATENKVVNQEKRIQEMIIMETELRKQLEDVKNAAISEKNHSDRVYMVEKLELIKKQEELTSTNEELCLQLQKVVEEKQNFKNIFEEKDKSLSKLQEEIFTYENKIEDLSCQNAELSVKYENTVDKGEQLTKQLESKMQEVVRLQENLNTRQQIESSLAKDLDKIENKYNKMLNDFINTENELKEMKTYNSDLERSIQDMKNSNEYKVNELNKKIDILEKEKEKILLEKRTKIQNLEITRTLLQEKYEKEITILKEDFDTKLFEMKKTIATQNSAFIKLNETLNKMNEGSQNKRVKHENIKKNESSVKEITQPIVELNLIKASRVYDVGSQTKTNQIYEIKEQQFQSEITIGTPKIIPNDKDETSNNKQQDVYNFNMKEVNDKLKKVSCNMCKLQKKITLPLQVSDYTESRSYSTQSRSVMQSNVESQENQERKDQDSTLQKKKIFKTRGTGLKQYGTLRKLYKK
ncbi:uncharacterized protein LOC143143323 [Ptiloglossa arizonensis]|uniref:uncharacterized protein LOC143143323 n=1 Tax=Ptiloglossa arizonensis TaxID=3350558 RepID=UPI003FA09C04